MDTLIEQIKKARFCWVVGNGGSAATAEHLVTDLVKKGYRAISLSSNLSLITMIANDYGYQHIFSQQLKTYGSKTDLLIVISCSGSSMNTVNAEFMASKIGMNIYEFEVFKRVKDYGLLEDKHLRFVHKLAKQL